MESLVFKMKIFELLLLLLLVIVLLLLLLFVVLVVVVVVEVLRLVAVTVAETGLDDVI